MTVAIMFSFHCQAQTMSAKPRIYTDLAWLNDENKLSQEIYYTSDTDLHGLLNIACYKYNGATDSILLYAKKDLKIKLKKGTESVKLDYKETNNNSFCLSEYVALLEHTHATPPGNYKTYISVTNTGQVSTTLLLHEVDSTLGPNSFIRKSINKSLLPRPKTFLGINITNTLPAYAKAGNLIDAGNNKINKTAKAKGLTAVTGNKADKSFIDLYFHDWYVGRYEMEKNISLSKQVSQQENSYKNNLPSFASNDLTNHPSLFSQFRTLKKDKKDEDEVKGMISVSTNGSNGQEPNSDLDNNYYELRSTIELPIYGMPVQIDGYYTSQDQHRMAKASYVHFHYDIDKAKDNLMKLVNGYNDKYQQTVSKSKGMDQVYQNFVRNLESQKGQLTGELEKELSVKNVAGSINFDSLKKEATRSAIANARKDTAGLKTNNPVDSTSKEALTKEQHIRDSVENKYKQAQDKYTKLLALEQKITKYQTLLTQNKNVNYFDSALAYDKMKGLSDPGQMSYKQMAKKADNLLPEGNVKKFATGLTSFDAGMFPKYESQYTMSGQMMKGLDMGYDFGFCQAGITLGKTQYIGRDGSVDNYSTYSGRIIYQPAKSQKLTLIYYGYTPSQNMLKDSFFKDIPVAAPSFKNPVSIISAKYDGAISKYVIVGSEFARSINSADRTGAVNSNDKTAYNFNIEGAIPNINISLLGNYSKAGNGFENNSLPISPAGTEQYKLGGRGDFFRSFLTLGIEYDYLAQTSFATTGGNKKWGFDIKTNSKRYPSLAFSYKPFSTFRSFTDTLSIPQRPILGAVWTGRASYQIKKHARSIRFMVLYNKSTSSMDTVSYGSNLLQFTTMYSEKKWMMSVNTGFTEITGSSVATSVNPITPTGKTTFININGSYTLSKALTINAGQDIGIAVFGFCKYGVNGGLIYKFDKLPLMARVNLRYMNYELNETDGWKQLYMGSVELNWKFKTKMHNN